METQEMNSRTQQPFISSVPIFICFAFMIVASTNATPADPLEHSDEEEVEYCSHNIAPPLSFSTEKEATPKIQLYFEEPSLSDHFGKVYKALKALVWS